MQSYDVRVWDLRKRTRTGRPTRFEVRWVPPTHRPSTRVGRPALVRFRPSQTRTS